MCETMGWEPEDIEDSVEMMRRTEDGRISLPHFVSWYSDDGMVRNVFSQVRKPSFLRHLILKTEHLPRQARDTHRENSKKRGGVFSQFDDDEDQKLRFEEFAELCEQTSSVRLRPDDVQDLFNSYDCTQSAAAGADDSLPVGEWLDSMGFGEYAEAFVSQVRRKRRFCDAIFILNTIIIPSSEQT
jgi:hypothetical protein